MNTGKTKYRWWEYPQYVAVTVLFVIPGAIAAMLKLLGTVWRIICWPARRLVRLVITAVLLFIIVVGGILYGYARPVELGSRTVTVIIRPGDSLAGVAERLRSGGVIRLRAALVYSGQWIGIDRKLTPGRYDFSGTVSLLTVLRKIRFADFVRVNFTV